MNHKSFPEAAYRLEIERLTQVLAARKKRKDFIALARFAVVILLAVSVYLLYPLGISYAALAGLVLVAIFIRLVILAANNTAAIENAQRLMAINKDEIGIAAGRYLHRPDGHMFSLPAHGYAGDLDIFGAASLYQYINRTTAEQGRQQLADWLLALADAATIAARQAAVQALAPQYQWRQQLQAYGHEQTITIGTEQKIAQWIGEADTFSNSRGWKALRWVYPVIAVGTLLLYITDFISGQLFFGAYLVFFLISGYVSRKVALQYIHLNKIVPEVESLSKAAAWIEQLQAPAAYLQEIQKAFTDGRYRSSASIRQLKGILDKFDMNLN
ncbi:MAG TPA: hypothetical protein VL307_02345, partial [Chitinophagaceae bacterium]|nr:hypothetical protein [Chitinophagaceae bacterium]